MLRESFSACHLPEFNNKMALIYYPHGVEKYFSMKLELIFNQSQKQSVCNWQVNKGHNALHQNSLLLTSYFSLLICLTASRFEFPPLLAKFATNFLKKRII